MMKRTSTKSLTGIAVLALVAGSLCAQDQTISAGRNQTIVWETTHTAHLNGTASSPKAKVVWSCPRNADVTFTYPFRPVTEVTFPRPGYYQLILSTRGSGKDPAGSSVLVNVCASHSYKERLADLIGLMTLDEKIGQLTNEADSVPRLGVRRYNYWSEALHGVLGNQATSFPQAVGMGATWEPELIHRVGKAISEEARVLNVVEGKGLTYWSPTIISRAIPVGEGMRSRTVKTPISFPGWVWPL
jgi:hypothetical protein